MEQKFHIPVMLDEILEYLNLAPGKIIVDATMGTAGHSLGILGRILPGGRLIGIDCDEESLELCRMRLVDFSATCEFVHSNFVDIDRQLKKIGISHVDGMLFDLGVSSFQLNKAQRGFSFQNDGPLDMRLDTHAAFSAYDLINNLDEEELSSVLWNFGEERWHNRIARLLVEERRKQPISTTLQLVGIVIRSIPYKYRHKYYRIHQATRTFQAVRIAVNKELEALETVLEKAVSLLKKNGRICVISFHSLEDRIVKHAFKKFAMDGLIKIITPKPITVSELEQIANPASRSSKLRVGERI
ncbi:MAG: 16S rRNA (cytosine(1402)-N(4))-methyltransferase RsmH [Candidatus Omnitrophota bacterium]|nr:16S rRNA (cytosine(1402)-N(4))-methyltransferase RsmH [Candidatus Omnitrophota bacterium]